MTPDRILLQPNTAMVFTIEGLCQETGLLSEQWDLKALVSGNKQASVIHSADIRADFVTPLLQFDPSLAEVGSG